MKGNMRIDKRFYEQIDRALAGVNLPVTVYTAGGEQVYPASPREIREEEIPSLPWEEDMAVFGSMRFLQLPNLKGMVVGLPLYLAGGQEILQLAGALLSTLARSIDRDMDRDEVLRRVLLDGLDGTELETLALEHGLEMDRQRCAGCSSRAKGTPRTSPRPCARSSPAPSTTSSCASAATARCSCARWRARSTTSSTSWSWP